MARWLGPELNAQFLALWGLVMGLGSVLSVIEQEAARQATNARIEDRPAPVAVLQLLGVATLLAVGVFALLATSPTGRAIFADDGMVVLISGLGVLGFAVQYVVRGVLLGTDATARYAVVIALEALARLALAMLAIAAGAPSSVVIGAMVIVVGCYAWLPLLRAVWRRVDLRDGAEPWGTVARKVVLLGGANGLSATVLTGFPTLATFILGSTGGLGPFFSAVTLTRVPLVLLAPVQALAVPVATRIIARGDRRALARLQRSVLATLLLVAVLGGVATYILGPFFFTMFFGSAYVMSGPVLTTLVVATVVIAGALLQAAILIALERYATVLVIWSAAAVAAALLLAATPMEAQGRALTAFVGCSIVACFVATVTLRIAISSPGARSRATAVAEAKISESGEPL